MRIYTSDEAALAAGLSRKRMNLLVKEGRLPVPNLACGRRFYTEEQVEQIRRVVETGVAADGSRVRFYGRTP